MSDSRIQLASGVLFDPLNPDPALIEVEDIAHALSLQCRFGGHVRSFYSVADHSVRVARLVSEEDALEALLHDAPEFALIDLPRPVKHALFGEVFRRAEAKLWAAIATRFGLRPELPEAVKVADNQLLVTEHRDLMPRLGTDAERVLYGSWWYRSIKPLPKTIYPKTSEAARALFLTTFHDLIGRRSLG